jgi:predicted nuclease with RNAse H fold
VIPIREFVELQEKIEKLLEVVRAAKLCREDAEMNQARAQRELDKEMAKANERLAPANAVLFVGRDGQLMIGALDRREEAPRG